ncbi:MAG: replication-associated recombination protein A [Campylobacteraceae bacterium]|jgi:putative ATPase|nr:replication-associated recombination protein A [Campylobacteraceae bacterium]
MENLSLAFRPKKIEDICGQKHLTNPNAPFFKLLKSGKMPHSMFFGPPGTGKTTMARVVANILNSPFYELDATSLKVEEFRKIFAQYQNTLTKPIIFIDEVHRLSKTQQEVLLIPMENNTAIIIGASTENPYFSLTAGIRSRAMLFEFKQLEFKDLEEVLERVRKKLEFTIDKEAKSYLINSSAGDSRSLLNLLEYALHVSNSIDLKLLKNLRPHALKDGVSSDDTHYNLISAMIKSVRGSDIDAALYYLARLIDGGESPDFIARRLAILSSEDIGNANPNALGVAANTLLLVSKIGYPEARIILAQCVVYLASSPKSNSSYIAIGKAQKYVSEERALKVPEHLKSPLNKGYLYPHDFGGWVKQTYTQIPVSFYHSNGIGFEKTLLEWHEKIVGKNKNH